MARPTLRSVRAWRSPSACDMNVGTFLPSRLRHSGVLLLRSQRQLTEIFLLPLSQSAGQETSENCRPEGARPKDLL